MRTFRSCARRAFTLVELLVVIAIIGVLVALLLAAVQAAREAANRMSCSSNLKQLGVAMHNHHGVYNRFPPGAGNDRPPFGNAPAGKWGSSWKVYLLPYIEQSSIYDRWNLGGEYGSGYCDLKNMASIDGIMISTFRCPSTPVEEFHRSKYDEYTSIDVQKMNTSYTGIAGSVVLEKVPVDDVANVRLCKGECPQHTLNGILSWGSRTEIASITDGTSNTWMIGEQSDHLRDSEGRPVVEGFASRVGNSSSYYGWTMGASHDQSCSKPSDWYDGRHYNCTSVRWGINQKGFANDAATGTNDVFGTNFPLSSAHPGGILIGLADGSVQFIAETTELDIISAMSTKSNGEAVAYR